MNFWFTNPRYQETRFLVVSSFKVLPKHTAVFEKAILPTAVSLVHNGRYKLSAHRCYLVEHISQSRRPSVLHFPNYSNSPSLALITICR